jgi:hypothetical protein
MGLTVNKKALEQVFSEYFSECLNEGYILKEEKKDLG